MRNKGLTGPSDCTQTGKCAGGEKRAGSQPSTTTTNGKGLGEGGKQGWQKANRSLAKGGGQSGAGIREAPPGSFQGASHNG